MAILEPQAPDALAAWGEFNNAFERKEYMEPYVAEEVAREMLAKDAALKVRFEEKLRDDPEFAASPRARLDFFYRLHPSWHERFNLYPVLRTAVVPGCRCHCVGGPCAPISLPRPPVTPGAPLHPTPFP